MKHRIALCAGLSALGVALATSVQAQVYVEPPRGYVEPPPQMVQGGLPPAEVLMVVRASGLRPLTQPARRGSQYVLLASDNMGGQLRVVVSAHNGRIVHAEPAHDPRFAYHPVRPRGLVPIGPPQQAAVAPPQYAAPPPDLRTPSPPPRAAPAEGAAQNHGLASAPDAANAAPTRPARTPLPRPRPAVASNETAPPEATPQSVPPATAAAPEQPASPPPAASSAAPAKPATETQMVPVAPLD